MVQIPSYDIPVCTQYTPQFRIGFHYWEFDTGIVMKGVENDANHIIFLIEGEISISINELHNKIIRQGEMIFLPMGGDYTGQTLTKVKLLLLSANRRHEPCASDFYADIVKKNPNFKYECKGVPMKEPVKLLADQIIYYLHHGINCNHFHEIKQTEFFLIIKQFYTPLEILSLFHDSLSTDIEFTEAVHSNYRKVKTVEELAALTGYGTKVFTRLFQKHFNTSPYRWMQEHKAHHVKGRLMNSSIPLKYIIDEFGFANAAHFNVFCRKHLGGTPLQIRRETNEGEKNTIKSTE